MILQSSAGRINSTQLVEAGVDVDFPVVYRALAGLDSIAQAAGRCNREGRLDKGEVVVFIPPKPAPPGLLRKGEDACREVLHDRFDNPLDRRLFAQYFERFYYACDLDEQRITDLLRVDGQTLAVNFRTAAERFQLIRDEDTVPVIVRYQGEGSEAGKWIATLRNQRPERGLMRKLQRYTVNIHRRDANRLLGQGDIEEALPGLYVQVSDWLYHPDIGFNPNGTPPTPTSAII